MKIIIQKLHNTVHSYSLFNVGALAIAVDALAVDAVLVVAVDRLLVRVIVVVGVGMRVRLVMGRMKVVRGQMV